MQYQSPFNNITKFINLAKYAISVKFVPANSSDDTDYIVQAVTCSNPIYNLNNGKELSYITNIINDTIVIAGNADYENNWIGTSTAKDWLKNKCFGRKSIGDEINDITTKIYQSCNEEGIHIIAESWCMWRWQQNVNENMDIYLGFDPLLHSYCNDGMGIYSYTNCLVYIYAFNTTYTHI